MKLVYIHESIFLNFVAGSKAILELPSNLKKKKKKKTNGEFSGGPVIKDLVLSLLWLRVLL